MAKRSLIRTYPVSHPRSFRSSPFWKRSNKKENPMANLSKESYIASIEESASIICKELGPEVVQSVYRRFGANDLEGIKTADLPDVFSELYAIEADLK
jgi:hypothetical protein